jgi:hypothetical protein
MTSHSHRNHHIHFPRFCETLVKSYLMQVCKPCHYTLVETVEPFKLHPMSMPYIYEVFETLLGCGWAYGFTLTPLPPQTFPQICESWVKSYLMKVCKPCQYALVEAVEPCKLHPMSMAYLYEVFECLLRLQMGIGFTFTLIPPQTLPRICESWLKSYLRQVCKPCHYNLIEAVEPFKKHPMSMSYIYEVFEHLLRIRIGIWLHTHIITTTDTSPDL